jgi:saccharopine dehydrogenase-like NADP-dependent oxidoreductase
VSRPHAERPFAEVGVKLGDAQFAESDRWRDAGLLALVGIGVEPGLSDVFARYAADHLFSEVDLVGVRDGADLVVEGLRLRADVLDLDHDRGVSEPARDLGARPRLVRHAAVLRAESFHFPAGIGTVECVNVEHEEVVLVPRWVRCRRVDFKYGLGADFIDVLQTLHRLGLDSTDPVRVRGVDVAPRDVVAATLPDPATLGDRMSGRTCAGTLVTGRGPAGAPRAVYLHHIVDNAWSMREYGAQAVVWQTALNPVVAMELLADGRWSGTGVLGPEAFDAVPFLDLLAAYGSPHAVEERRPEAPAAAP